MRVGILQKKKSRFRLDKRRIKEHETLILRI